MEFKNKDNMMSNELTENEVDAEAQTRQEKTGKAESVDEITNKAKEISAPDLGKFKSVNALLQAYNSLQAEFTRRSQRLKELEGALPQTNNPLSVSEPVTDETAQKTSNVAPMPEIHEEISLSAEQKQRVIEEYLSDIKRSSVPLMTAGVSVMSPAAKAKNFTEAGKMALGYFRGSK